MAPDGDNCSPFSNRYYLVSAAKHDNWFILLSSIIMWIMWNSFEETKKGPDNAFVCFWRAESTLMKWCRQCTYGHKTTSEFWFPTFYSDKIEKEVSLFCRFLGVSLSLRYCQFSLIYIDLCLFRGLVSMDYLNGFILLFIRWNRLIFLSNLFSNPMPFRRQIKKSPRFWILQFINPLYWPSRFQYPFPLYVSV